MIKWIRNNLHQKIRFILAMVFLFPIIFLFTFVNVMSKYVMGMCDMVRDAYKGSITHRNVDNYIIDRFYK